MQAVTEDFELRANEVRSYLRMLKAMDRSDAVIYSPGKPSHKTIEVKDDWRLISKASVYLLIYNLVESSIRSSFGELYSTLKAQGCTINDVSNEVRSLWLSAQYRKLTKGAVSANVFESAAAKMVLLALDKELLDLDSTKMSVSGNLDARKIRELCSSHGVSDKTSRWALGGRELKFVKDQRNALAHGDYSFSECGRDVTVEDLLRISKQTEVYIRSIIKNVAKYIDKKSYSVNH